MPHLDERDLDTLAQLARLDLAGADRDGLRGDLERILTYVDRLADVDDPDIAPLRHPAQEAASDGTAAGVGLDGLRADEPVVGRSVDALAELAPDWREGWVAVPRTVDQDG